MPHLRRAVIFLAVFACTAGFDQGTKEWARTLPEGVPQPVIDGVWDWQLALNKGVAFSSLQDLPHAQIVLSVLGLAILAGILVMAARTRPEQRLERVTLALVAGGAVGNLIDRIRDGAVIDFIRWRAGEHMWPIFNVADVALVVGVGLLLLETALARKRRAMLTS